MQRIITIYERDKWNKIIVLVNGRHMEVIEIDEQWGEQTSVFSSVKQLRHWVALRFAADRFDGDEPTRQHILQQFTQFFPS